MTSTILVEYCVIWAAIASISLCWAWRLRAQRNEFGVKARRHEEAMHDSQLQLHGLHLRHLRLRIRIRQLAAKSRRRRDEIRCRTAADIKRKGAKAAPQRFNSGQVVGRLVAVSDDGTVTLPTGFDST